MDEDYVRTNAENLLRDRLGMRGIGYTKDILGVTPLKRLPKIDLK